MNEKTKLAILNSVSFILWLALAFILLGSDISGDSILSIICITVLYVLGMLGFVLKFRNKLKSKFFLALMFVFDLIYAAFFIYFAFC